MSSPDFSQVYSANSQAAKIRGLRIALLGYRSDPFVGGQGIYLHYLSAALRDAGHIVDVYSGPPYPELAPGVRLIKVPSLNLFASPNHVRALRRRHLTSFSDLWEWFSMLTGGFAEPYTFGRRVVKKLANEQYDIIHDNQSLCYGLLSLQKKGHTLVSTIHHPIHRDRALAVEAAADKLHKTLAKRWYSFVRMQEKVVRHLPHIVTVSHYSKQDIQQHFGCEDRAITVIPNGIDTQRFQPLKNIAKNQFQLITTASADQPLKGLPFLLRSVAALKQDFPELTLVVIGKLKTHGSTEALIKELRLQDRITFYSGISTEQLVEHYAKSVMAICPSLYEGFGLPVAEAMACGLPVISSDGGALPEVVGKAGVIVPAGNTDALTKAIANLLTDPEQRAQLAIMARQHIVDNFCWQKVAQQLTAYYSSLLPRYAHR